MTPPGRILLREHGYVITLTGLVLASSAHLLASTYHLAGSNEAVYLGPSHVDAATRADTVAIRRLGMGACSVTILRRRHTRNRQMIR
jgi:hypothetical protein